MCPARGVSVPPIGMTVAGYSYPQLSTATTGILSHRNWREMDGGNICKRFPSYFYSVRSEQESKVEEAETTYVCAVIRQETTSPHYREWCVHNTKGFRA